MKIKKPKGGRRSLAFGELASQASDEQTAESNISTENLQDEDHQEPKKSKLRRSLGGKVEKSRRSSKINKWSILDMLGFGGKKNKSRKSEIPNENAPNPTEATNGTESSSDELNESITAASEAGHTPKKRDQVKPIDTKNPMDLGILQENTTIRKRKPRLSLDIVSTPMLFRKNDRKVADNLMNSAGKSRSASKAMGKKGPEITLNMITSTKKRLRSTSEAGAPDVEPDIKSLSKAETPNEKPRNKITRDTRYVHKPSGIPVRCAKQTKPDANARKPPLARRKPNAAESVVRSDKTNTRADRARTGAHNIRHAGNTPPKVSRRDSMNSRPECNIARRESMRRELESKGSVPQLHESNGSAQKPPRRSLIPQQSSGATKTFEPKISLKYFDDDVTEDDIQNSGVKGHVISLSEEDLAALDVATNLSVPNTGTKTCTQKRESLVEAMKKSPLLSPECHQIASASSADENLPQTPLSESKSTRKSLMSSVSSTLSRSLQSSKSSLRSLRLRKSKTPQDDIGTPRTHLRAVKRAHSIAVTSDIARLRGSPMLTPLSSVAKELREMKGRKKRKEPSLEQIIKEHRKNKREENTSKKPPPKPPRKNLKGSRSVSRGRLRRKSAMSDDGKTENAPKIKVKRKPSIKDMLVKRKPPPKPARRSSGSKQDGGLKLESEIKSQTEEHTVHSRTSSIGEGVKKLRRKLSRVGDMKRDERGPGSQAQVMSAKAGHTPRPPRGRKDERLV